MRREGKSDICVRGRAQGGGEGEGGGGAARGLVVTAFQ